MANGVVKVLTPGFFCTVQDSGRFGYQAAGIPVSGAMDKVAYLYANWLVENMLGAPCIEMSLMGPTLYFETAAVVAVTGANGSLYLDKDKVPSNSAIKVKPKQILRIGNFKRGCRAYLAIQGLQSETWLGSCSYLTGLRQPGNEARILKKNSVLIIESNPVFNARKLPDYVCEYYPNSITVRFLRGLEFNRLQNPEILTSTAYRLLPASNRIGLKLQGTALKLSRGTMISTGMMRGTIQLPPMGLPIILMNDGPPTGGYCRIGQIIAADMYRLAQMRPNSSIRFQEVTTGEALKAYEQFLLTIENFLESN